MKHCIIKYLSLAEETRIRNPHYAKMQLFEYACVLCLRGSLRLIPNAFESTRAGHPSVLSRPPICQLGRGTSSIAHPADGLAPCRRVERVRALRPRVDFGR